MKPWQRKKLLTLVNGLRRSANASNAESHRKYKKAGHDFNGGTGDEGWQEVFRLDGTSTGLDIAANRLQSLINYFEKEQKRKRK